MRPNLINRLKEEWNNLDPVDPLRGLIADAIDALAEQPAQQEPVAWMIWTHGPVLVFMNKDEASMEFDRLNHAYPEPTRMLVPLYSSPPASKPWVSLTDEEIELIYSECNAWDKFEYERMFEAKLKEKNT